MDTRASQAAAVGPIAVADSLARAPHMARTLAGARCRDLAETRHRDLAEARHRDLARTHCVTLAGARHVALLGHTLPGAVVADSQGAAAANLGSSKSRMAQLTGSGNSHPVSSTS